MADSLFIATVGSANSSGITLIIPPETTPTEKRYKRILNGQTLSANHKVLVASISGTYVVLGRVDYS